MEALHTYRIQSVLEAATIAVDIANVSSFSLSELEITAVPSHQLPSNLRLGHVIEKIVAHYIRSSKNYIILHENLQIIEGKQTLGELDFILLNKTNQQTLHLEIAYKFYLLDPSISEVQTNCWIGPNRRDSFVEKIAKLAQKQFPILKHSTTKQNLADLHVPSIQQRLCFMAHLFLPFGYRGKIEPQFQKAIKGYYVTCQAFLAADHTNSQYHIPSKKNWGIAPKHNLHWANFEAIKQYVEVSISERQSPLVWVKTEEGFEEVFVVWWGVKY